VTGRLLPRSWPARIAWSVGLILVLALAGDRIAAGIAARTVADTIACTVGGGTRPSVAFGGGPFLPQAVSGRFTDVEVTAHGLRRNDLPIDDDIPIDTVDAHLYGAALSDRHVEHASIDVTIGYAALPGSVAGHRVSYRALNGSLAIDIAVDIAGRPVPVTALVDPAISGTTLRLTPREVDALGVRVPAVTVLGNGFGPDLNRPLPVLPAGLRYSAVSATDTGLRINVTGDDLTMPAGPGCP
jgi:hypothetical protein